MRAKYYDEDEAVLTEEEQPRRIRRSAPQRKSHKAVAFLLVLVILLEIGVGTALVLALRKLDRNSESLDRLETAVADLAKPAETVSVTAPPTEELPPVTTVPETEPLETEPPETEPPVTENPRLAQVAAPMDALETALTEELTGLASQWAVYAEDLETGYSVGVGNRVGCNDRMISASLIKIFIMAASYEKIAQGEMDEDTYYRTIYYMIIESDNACTNTMIKALGGGSAETGFEAVNAYAKSIGCEQTELNRLMLDNNGKENYVSAMDCARLLRMIYEGTCVNPYCSEQMMNILKDQTAVSLIPAGLPEGVVTAHKTGNLTGLCRGDVGIVFAEPNPYILCIICNEPSSGSVEAEFPLLSSMVYDAMTSIPAA